jgi:hypothetical protein
MITAQETRVVPNERKSKPKVIGQYEEDQHKEMIFPNNIFRNFAK